MGKLGSVAFCLLFAVVFGGVGVFASWAIGSTVLEAQRAKDWVRVKASVDDASLDASRGSKGSVTYRAGGRYRYAFQGRQYTGSRLGISSVGGSDNIDDWHQEVNARLEDARAAGKPITVWVNPDNPSESVFDREMRWSEIVFLIPFALAFGGVGVGALVALVFVLRSKGEGGAQAAVDRATSRRGANGQANAAPGFLWFFAFMWNAISFPIAFLAIPDIVERGEWVGLLVLLFPLVGIGLLWAAVSATWAAWLARRGAGKAPARARPAASAPGRFAAQAARAMFDPQAAAASRLGAGPAGRPEVDIPPAIAEIEERGGTLTLRYSARRRLGLAIALLLTGSILSLIGMALFFAGDGLFGGVVMFVIGGLLDVSAVALFVGNLTVTVKAGELSVEQASLFGRKSWRLRREAIRSLQPTVSYTVNGLPYYSLHADTLAERVPVGNSLKGADVADAVARRIARALGAPPSIVAPAGGASPYPIPD
jgi:hypothetical protein